MEGWDDILRKAANKACNTLKSTELQRNYCKVGFYRGIIDGARFGQKEEVLEEPMEFEDLIGNAEFLDNEIQFFEGDIPNRRNSRGRY